MTFLLSCMGYISCKKVVVKRCKMVELREKKSHSEQVCPTDLPMTSDRRGGETSDEKAYGDLL